MDEFYGDMSKADQMVDDLRATIRASVRTEITSKIKRLEDENRELTQKQLSLNTLTAEAEKLKRDLELEKDIAYRQACNLRFQELLGILGQVKYFAKSEWLSRDKCDQCDEKQKYVFTAPNGQVFTQACKCANGYQHHTVKEAGVWTLEKSSRESGKIVCYYEVTADDGIRSSSANLYDGKPFDETKSYPTVLFDTPEQCQDYCDYLNARSLER